MVGCTVLTKFQNSVQFLVPSFPNKIPKAMFAMLPFAVVVSALPRVDKSKATIKRDQHNCELRVGGCQNWSKGFFTIPDLVQTWSRLGPDRGTWLSRLNNLDGMSGHAFQIFDWSRPHFHIDHPNFLDEAAPPYCSRPPRSSHQPDHTQSSCPFFRRIMPWGRSRGVMNYKNEILINIISNLLPNDEYAWQAVATAYHAESGETDICDTSDLKKHWHKVLCNGGKKPTGKPGAVTDRIFGCIAIEQQILDKTSSGMMGASSLEDENNISLTSTEGSKEGDDDNEEEDYVNRPESCAGNDLVGGIDFAYFAAPLPPLPHPVLNEVPPVQNEVVAAVEGGAVQNEVSAAIDGAPPANGGDPNAQANRRRGSTLSRKSSKNDKSLSQKTKNSNNKNKERTNVAGAIVKLCESFKDGGTARNDDSTRDMMNIMMMNQMTMMGARMERQGKEEQRERKRARKGKMKKKAKKGEESS
jgi:hypothetical protein